MKSDEQRDSAKQLESWDEAVPVNVVCNGIIDCADGSDEVACDPSEVVICGNGETLPLRDRCDGSYDYLGNEDEIGCADMNVAVCF